MNEPCKCTQWCRVDIAGPYHVTTSDGLPLITNHHPNCEHYNDSLIDVWEVSDGNSSYFTHEKEAAEAEARESESVTIAEKKMHREIYENLPEFNGF